MSNLKQAVDLASLNTKRPSKPRVMSAIQVARRVFQLAAQAGTPFENITPRKWAKKWLASKEFVLTTIGASKAALPTAPKNPNQVLRAAAVDAPEPIVVDVNKNAVGASAIGYVPPIIVVDGKHRHVAAKMQGRSQLEAWVGVKAMKLINANATVSVGKVPTPSLVKKSKLESAAILAQSVPRQDRAYNGSAPHMPMPGMKGTKLYSQGGPGASSSLGGGSGPTPKVMADASDVTPHHDPSDRYDKPKGQSLDPSDVSGFRKSPGAGVGPRVSPSKGGSKSDIAQMSFARVCAGKKGCVDAGPVHISKIVTDYKAACAAGYKPSLKGKAAPGWEGTVKRMKSHPEIDNPYALTNWMDEQGYQSGGSKSK